MSGGVGPTCSDINLQEEEIEAKRLNSTNASKIPSIPLHQFFTFQQLNALAVVVVFSASGMVCIEDFVFAIFSFFYVFFMSRVAFPPLNPSSEPPIFEKNRLLGLYNSIGVIVGLFVPIAYIFEGIYEGDKEGIKAAAPHVFLLASQMFMEGVVSSGRFSPPIRAFVLVFYNTKRIMAIAEWVRNELGKAEEEFGTVRRLQMGRGLALANLVFWSFNLFGFMLPFYFPRAFKRYYGYKIKD